MNAFRSFCFAFVSAAIFGLPAASAAQPAPQPPEGGTPTGGTPTAVKTDAATIARAIKDLGHDDYAVREAASKQLWRIGLAGESALREAVKNSDPEIRQRARLILEKFELGLTPDMPPEFELLIINFRQSQFDGKRTILYSLIDEKKVKTALQLARSEKEPTERDSLINLASRHAQRFIPDLLIRGDIDEAEAILESVDIVADSTLERLTATLLVTGRLPDRLKAVEEQLKESRVPAVIKRAIYYRRASGDLAGAAELAGAHSLPYYQRAILIEQGDWAAAAKAQQKIYAGERLPADVNAFTAALEFFSGDSAAANVRLKELRTNATEQLSTYWDVAEAHLACEQPEEAIKVLSASIPGAASYYQGVRMHYAESQAHAGVTKDTTFDKTWYDKLVDGGLVATQMRVSRPQFARDIARQLHSLGETERGRQIVNLLRAEAEADKSGQLWLVVLEADMVTGNREQALRDLAGALGRPGVTNSTALAAVYPKDFMLADALYIKLGAEQSKRAESLALIEKLLGPAGNTEEERKALAVRVAEEIEPWHALGDYRLHLRAGEISLKLSDRKAARRWFERAAGTTTDGAIRLGDLAREDQDWDEAARWYRAALEKLPALPLPRFMLGQALIGAGKGEEGKAEQQRATLAALAPVTRYAFATQLKDRGFRAAAAEQALILQRTSNPTVQHPTIAAGHLRGNLIYEAEPRVAANLWQRWELSMLSGVNNYSHFEHYMADPEVIHRARARALLKEGKTDAAITELRRVLILLPGNVRMIEEFHPLLNEAGQEKIAAALFTEVASRYEQVIRDYPKTTHHRRDLALMAARCGKPAEALKLAQEAVQLDDELAANYDVLAEAHYHRGEQAQAIAAGTKALDLEKNNSELRARLERWKQSQP